MCQTEHTSLHHVDRRLTNLTTENSACKLIVQAGNIHGVTYPRQYRLTVNTANFLQSYGRPIDLTELDALKMEDFLVIREPGRLSRYSDWLRTEGPRIRGSGPGRR
jgi:hypothetical protein